ncbi:hypothetical protein BKA70DRAFT_1320005 [Coprinopsis sp. MPI-PUGE-AT-0042]|nr:hypothetical protein BKA70DRAFT_1320005 [Coprinopsis sp. MPI-PUGE-AT-0042]
MHPHAPMPTGTLPCNLLLLLLLRRLLGRNSKYLDFRYYKHYKKRRSREFDAPKCTRDEGVRDRGRNETDANEIEGR